MHVLHIHPERRQCIQPLRQPQRARVVLGERGGSGVCGVEGGVECLEGGRREYPALCDDVRSGGVSGRLPWQAIV